MTTGGRVRVRKRMRLPLRIKYDRAAEVAELAFSVECTMLQPGEETPAPAAAARPRARRRLASRM